jgi:hypothetical protein
MKFKCRGCNDIFDVPDGKGITRAICPFCDQANDLREPAAPEPTFPENAMAAKTFPHTFKPVKPPPHPLAPQFWILAICALIITTIIAISFLFTLVSMVEQGKASEKAMEEVNKATEELNHTLDKAGKEMQRSLQNIVKP